MGYQFALVDEGYKHTRAMKDRWPGKEAIQLVGARNQSIAFQVLVKAEEAFILSVTDTPVFSPRGPLPCLRLKLTGMEEMGCQVSMYLEGMVEDDDHEMKADILLHQEFITVEQGEIQPVWVEITVPKEGVAGILDGKIQVYSHRLFEDEVKIGELDVTLDVKDVILPDPADHTFFLDLWQHLSNISRKHEVPLWSEDHFRVAEFYVKSLAELGQKAVTIIATEIPWSGQGCFNTRDDLADLFEYSMARVHKDKGGKWRYDFSIMDRYIELCFSYGIDEEIEVFGLSNIWMFPEEGYGKLIEDFPDGCRVRYLDEGDGTYKYMRTSQELHGYIKALESHFIQKGWMDRVRIVADEPADTALYRERISLLKRIAPSFTFKTAINHAEFIQEFKDEVQDYVPVLPCVAQEWELVQKLKKEMKGRICWYVCCWPPLPNTFIGSPLTESCLIGWLTAYMGLDGFLRWNYTVWPEKPREKITYRFPNWAAGDTNFVYPARDGRPLLTLRYKLLKRGIEDFELIKRIEREHPNPAEVLKKAYSMILKTEDMAEFHPSRERKREDLYSLDYGDYQEARKLLLEELEKLS